MSMLRDDFMTCRTYISRLRILLLQLQEMTQGRIQIVFPRTRRLRGPRSWLSIPLHVPFALLALLVLVREPLEGRFVPMAMDSSRVISGLFSPSLPSFVLAWPIKLCAAPVPRRRGKKRLHAIILDERTTHLVPERVHWRERRAFRVSLQQESPFPKRHREGLRGHREGSFWRRLVVGVRSVSHDADLRQNSDGEDHHAGGRGH
jgi:hypothetical protein